MTQFPILNELQNISAVDPIFLFHEDAVEFCIRHGIILEEIPCNNPRCGSQMKIERRVKSLDKKVYSCKNNQCNWRSSLKNGSKFKGINVELRKILRIAYCFVYNYHVYQAINYCEVN